MHPFWAVRRLTGKQLALERDKIPDGQPKPRFNVEIRTEVVSNVSHELRGVFAHLRKLTSERGERDVERVLLGEAGCRDVLQMLGKPPTLHSRSFLETIGDGRKLRVCASSGGSAAKSSQAPVLRVATWNIAGGHRSSQAPARFAGGQAVCVLV